MAIKKKNTGANTRQNSKRASLKEQVKHINNEVDEETQEELSKNLIEAEDSIEESLEEPAKKIEEDPTEAANPDEVSDFQIFSRDNNHYNHKFATQARRQKRNIIIASCCALFLVLVGVGTAWALTFLNSSFDDDDLRDALTQNDNFEDPFYMLLMGTDTREDEGSYQLTDGRSDTCMVARIDPKNYVVSIVSIPRDTKITYKGTTEKFNAAYNSGGAKATIDIVNKMFNIEISHYAEISFNGLTDLVDAVGGVEVDVPTSINDSKAGTSVPSGHQTLNGDQALAFARSRNFADGDFTRTADQRVLVDAMIQKAYTMDLFQLPNVIQAAKKFVKTDLSVMQMYSLASQFKNAGQLTIYTSMVPSTTGSLGGASYCFCDSDALARMIKLMEINEDPNFVEITSGASLCSSRDKTTIDKNRTEHFKDHPDCPGKASNSKQKSTNSITDSQYSSSGSSSSNSSSSSSSNSSSNSSSQN